MAHLLEKGMIFIMKKKYLFFCIILFIFLMGCANIKINNTKNVTKKLSFINYNVGYIFGNKNAKIVIVEYSSYECIDCRHLHKNIGPLLKKYIDSGDVLYIYKPVDHPKFINDGKINKYFAPSKYDDIESIFNKFDSYSHKSYATVKNVLNLSEKEVPNYETMRKTISKEISIGKITGTPTMYVNGNKYKNIFTEYEFQKIINSYSK